MRGGGRRRKEPSNERRRKRQKEERSHPMREDKRIQRDTSSLKVWTLTRRSRSGIDFRG